MSTEIQGVSHLDRNELAELLDDPEKSDIYVVDVREPEEFISGHIPGVPLVPMGHIPELVEHFDKDAEYVFICRSGQRSFNVAKYFQMNGFEKVHNFLGGMLSWDGELAYGPEGIVDEFSMDKLSRNHNNS
ncbi:rhodanese-like domain-containing protein [Xylanibacillus composti]|uniref:Rhodanese domain-containing protein n=1 Tax=Xylanibacillus composti TaxID=1572762 RepID=A0A8J4H3I0_9BACL|nr:rhodanese-like domain-containing protein [Xylanibacillus composti]MDT9727127.1 rhodanese-like domain-containing protein [Xylanibacillus composti]GIQ68861.1 hypothetical protein XYCOK13_16850 [Xylanibacillus composti]